MQVLAAAAFAATAAACAAAALFELLLLFILSQCKSSLTTGQSQPDSLELTLDSELPSCSRSALEFG